MANTAVTPSTTGLRLIRVALGRVLKVSTVFDTYWRFAVKRQDLFMKRVVAAASPWTDDPVLATYRFTNTYRASDRVSQFLIKNVLYAGKQTIEEIFFRTLLFKIFNRIETWNKLVANIGELTWKHFDFERYACVLDDIFSRGKTLYSAAYIMPSPSFGNARKHRNHLRLLEHMMHDKAPKKASEAKSLKEVFGLLRSYSSLGDFLAFQFTIDLNYSNMMNFSEMDFVVAGPGARDGIRKCFIDTAGFNESDIIKVVAELADSEFQRQELTFQTLWGRSLQLIDCQNIFCEVDKYARVVHPEYTGESGRTRIKQKFNPKSTKLPQWYPPKWDLNEKIAKQFKPELQVGSEMDDGFTLF